MRQRGCPPNAKKGVKESLNKQQKKREMKQERVAFGSPRVKNAKKKIERKLSDFAEIKSGEIPSLGGLHKRGGAEGGDSSRGLLDARVFA